MDMQTDINADRSHAAVQGRRAKVEKEILEQICNSRARIRYLQESIDRIDKRRDKLIREGNIAADVVACGKRGKKSLGTVLVRGTSYAEEDRLRRLLNKRKQTLKKEYDRLLEQTTQAEEYIAEVDDIEIRNILSLYYIDDLNWIQVAHKMNELYNSSRKKYTDGSCRRKHDRFLEKK